MSWALLMKRATRIDAMPCATALRHPGRVAS